MVMPMKSQRNVGLRMFIAANAALSLCSVCSYAHELRATMVPSCPTSDAPAMGAFPESLAPLAVGIISSLTGSLVDNGIAALKKTVNPDATNVDASFLELGLYSLVETKDPKGQNIKAISLNKTIGCLVVAVGDFQSGSNTWTLPFVAEKDKVPTAVVDLSRSLALSGPPAIYFEAAIQLSPDKSAVTWRPTRIYVGEFLNPSFWAGKSRGLQLSMKLYKPSSDKPFYAQDFKFDSVSSGFSKSLVDLQAGSQGTWGTLPAASAESPKDVLPSPGFGSPFDPFTLNIQLIETPKPYKLASAFADAADANKASIKTVIDQTVDPSKKQSADLTAQGSTLSAVSTYLSSWQKAYDACATSKVVDGAGQLSCKIAIDQATIDKTKADAACAVSNVASCKDKEKLVLPPPAKS